MMKKITSLLIVIMLCFGLAGCGSSDDGKGTDGESADAGTLTFWAYEPQSIADKEAYQELIKEFSEKSGITVKVSFIPKDSFNTKLNSAIANGKQPDISYLDQPQIAEYVQDEILLEITDIFDGGLKKEDFFSSALETNCIDGKYYGVPLNITTSVLLYNKDMVSESDLPKDWAGWVELCKGIAENPTKAAFEGIGTGGYCSWYFQAFLNSAGGSLTNEAQDKITFDDEKGMIAGKLIKQLYEYSPLEVRNSTSSFGNGNVAFKLGGGSDIDSLEANFPTLNFGAAAIPPYESGGISYSNIGGENLVVYAQSSNQKDAKRLVEFLSQEENAAKVAKYTGNFSALKNIADTENPKKQVVLKQLETAVARPQLSGWITVNDSYLATAIENIINGDDIEKNLETAAKQAEALIFN